jgi:hypothetical protein
MDIFCELLKDAIVGGDDLESAMRKAVNKAAKEAINMVMGNDDEGTPLVVGYPITLKESAEAYRELLAGFRSRGLEEVEATATDGLSGFDEVVSESYPKAKRQRCFAHLLLHHPLYLLVEGLNPAVRVHRLPEALWELTSSL